MKKLLSKILPCFLVVLLLLGVASCKPKPTESAYAHPSKEPMVSNADAAFLTLGGKAITNRAVYNRLIQTYGLDAIIAWMDEITLEDFEYDQDDFKEHLDFIIYGTTDPENDLSAEEMAEKEKEHNESMFTQGYETEAEWKQYYELEYKRYAYGLSEYEKHVDKLNADAKTAIFNDEIYQTTFESIFQNDYTVIILTFDSDYEAKQILAEHDIDLRNLTFGWQKDGKALTAEEIKSVFTQIHQAMNPGVSAEQTFKHNAEEYKHELANYSATIANKVAGLETIDADLQKSYTHAPVAYGSRFFLALKVAETSTYGEYKDATEEQKAEVKKYLLESSITSSFLLASAQQKAAVKIYDEGLEVGYNKYYNDNITEAKLELDKYVTTTDENDKVVAEFTFNGEKHQLTADQLFERLLNKYGAALSLLYAQEYIVLSNPEFNKVTEYATGKVLDQETYDKYYKTDIQSYKDALAKGDYASKGFPANYGWDKFMLDYFGVATEAELMALYGGSLYSAAEGYFIKDIYMDEEIKDEEGNVTQTADHLVQAEMEKIFEEYFSASMIGVYAYFDKAANGLTDNIADEMTDEEEALAKEFVELVYAQAKKERDAEINGTLAAGLEEVVKQYKSTPYFSVNQWTKYKKAGLQLVLVTSQTYTNTSTADEAILAEAEKQYNLVKEYKINNVKPFGQTLDPGYRTIDGVAVTIKADLFGDMSEAFISNNAAYRLVITKAIKPTYIKENASDPEKDPEYKPTLEQYESYQKDSSNVSSTIASAIKAYYTPAIANLTKATIISDKLFNTTKDLINDETIKFESHPELKATVLKVIEQSLNKDE